MLGEVRYHEDSFADALRLYREAAEAAEAADDPRLLALVELRVAHALVNAAGDLAEAASHAARALERLEANGPRAVLAEGLAVSTMLEFQQGHGIDQGKLERALALEDRNHQVVVAMRPSLIAGFLMLYVGRFAEARGRLCALRERILDRGQESDVPIVSTHLAWIECWSGNLQAAHGYACEADDVAIGLGSPSLRAFTLAFVALVAAHQGEAEVARRAVTESSTLARETGWALSTLWASWALALLELSHGNAAGAATALEPLTETTEASELLEPINAFYLAEGIEALIGTGHLERAERLLTMLEDCARRLDRTWALAAAARCRGLQLAARGDPAQALVALDAALAQHARVDMPLERARTLLARGMIERRLRRKQVARDSLTASLEVFSRAGAAQWAERARAELDRVGLRPRSPAGLTASERRVAELAAAGLTNREVAAAAFMSQKTVEANLSRIYRKLEIRSRAELGLRLANTSK